MSESDVAFLAGDRPPLVSVYITNHNYGRFLEQSVQSVLGQTMDDFELIVIDDGSADDSREIIAAYAEHPKVLPIFQRKKGLAVSNNIALKAARGKYVMRLDADDYLDPNALHLLSGALEREPEAGLVFPDYYIVDADGHVLELVRRHDFTTVTLMDQPCHGACTMFRRELLLQIGGYDESLSCQDGYDIWLRLIKRCGVRNINLPLFYYRRHGANLTCREDRILTARADIYNKLGRGGRLRTAGVIPVRGRSLDPGCPAMRLLGGKPLIDWTIEAALSASRLARVIVTTPDRDILAHVAGRFPGQVEAVCRETKLALPNVPIEESLLHAVAKVPEASPLDALVVLYVESPFRKSEHIDAALAALEFFETDEVVGVRPDTDQFYTHNGAGLVSIRSNGQMRLEREDLYREAGQVRAVRFAHLEKSRRLGGGTIGHMVVDQTAALRLRSELDWEIARLVAGRLAPATDNRKG